VTVWDPRVVSHPDPAMLADAGRHALVVTVEDGVRQGGAGMFLADALRKGLPIGACPPIVTKGVPRSFLAQGSRTASWPASAWTRTASCAPSARASPTCSIPSELRSPVEREFGLPLAGDLSRDTPD